jgi:hypothetical protein
MFVSPGAFQFRNKVKKSGDILFSFLVLIYSKVSETVAAIHSSIPSTLDSLFIAVASTNPFTVMVE